MPPWDGGELLRMAPAFAAFVTFMFVVILGERVRRHVSRSRQLRIWGVRPTGGRVPGRDSDVTDIGFQLRAVMAASFKKRRILNNSEYQVFTIIENELKLARTGHRVFAQTSLGEILTSPESDAFHSINSKRIDILVVDVNGWPVLAVEYQGGGHYQGDAAGRDAVKKEALRKAGIRYLEVSEADTADQIRCRAREYLGLSTPSGPNHSNPSPWDATEVQSVARR